MRERHPCPSTRCATSPAKIECRLSERMFFCSILFFVFEQHVCMKGRAEFKMSMQREAQLIKDCLTFAGPPDPLRGEEIYRRYDATRILKLKWPRIGNPS